MSTLSKFESLIKELPDADSSRRFFEQFSRLHPAQSAKLSKNEGLLSDVLTLISFSPLLAATLLQHPEYIAWLSRRRSESNTRGKDELLESLARFALTNSQIGPQILFARFRRRELLRIFLRDIRKTAGIAEITDEISNLADAILEKALTLAKQELDNRYGPPLEIDDKGRSKPAQLCVVSLGKLGSRELNYASDIDLLFLYSADGKTSGGGTRDAITNREYFGKLAESIIRLVGRQTGEGAAYRVDLRLRPHGRVGALAISVKDAARYYKTEAVAWERQVLIRSRSSAGSEMLYKKFFKAVESTVFSIDLTVEEALKNVRSSKEMIDFEHRADKSFNVKLGRGGIREIEFIAQALQLAHGGKDRWLRVPHTLISLSRLADRGHLIDLELTSLFDAYEFLRRLEHLLQMENGLQTHNVPADGKKRLPIAKRCGFESLEAFDAAIETVTGKVRRVFARIFGEAIRKQTIDTVRPNNAADIIESSSKGRNIPTVGVETSLPPTILAAFEKSGTQIDLSAERIEMLKLLIDVSPKFTAMLAAFPQHVNDWNGLVDSYPARDFGPLLLCAVQNEKDFRHRLSALRKLWSKLYLEIAVFDVLGKLSTPESKRLQTNLAEASIKAALFITREEMSHRLGIKLDDLPLAVLALGKLGGGGIDYESDLDLLLMYDDEKPIPAANLTHIEFYSRAVEIFVTALSSMTRDGSLYRVDLRLRPHGGSGPSAVSKSGFLEYMRRSSEIWELLAYVKIRGVAGEMNLARSAEIEIRRLIHELAAKKSVGELSAEVLRLRNRLEQEKTGSRAGKDVDIKFGAGGMLDVYFVVRFLQLRDNLPDTPENRSTARTLQKLLTNKSLAPADFEMLNGGYEFLSALDHALRITVGRRSRLPSGNPHALQTIAGWMNLESPSDLREQLTIHRLNIRSAFENILA